MQVGKISSYNLEKNYSAFYYEIAGQRWDYVTRVFHNQEQIVRCQLRDGTANPQGVIKYWNMDGTEAAQFTIGSGGVPYTQILDAAWKTQQEKLLYITMDQDLADASSYALVQADPDGASPTVLIPDIAPTDYAAWATASVSGYVGLATSDDNIYVKVGSELFELPYTTISGGSDWSTATAAGSSCSDCFHYGDGTECMNLMYRTVSGSGGYVLYSWYDWDIDTLYLRSVTTSGGLGYNKDRWAMLDISNYSDIQFPLFLNDLDTNALHLLTTTDVSGQTVTSSGAYLEVFNIDHELAAFLNVNSSDVVMPAGVGATSTILARVTNCWGTTLSGKLVQFWVSSGDGGVNPSSDYTDNLGRAYTTFTTGANVGISNVAVVVNET